MLQTAGVAKLGRSRLRPYEFKPRLGAGSSVYGARPEPVGVLRTFSAATNAAPSGVVFQRASSGLGCETCKVRR
jgi:hypothetical protein